MHAYQQILPTDNVLCCTLFGFLHGVQGEFTDDVSHLHWSNSSAVKMELKAVSETSSVNSLRTPCKNPQTKNNIHSKVEV
jgi:hypothetical protein